MQTDPKPSTDDATERPRLSQTDWDSLAGEQATPDLDFDEGPVVDEADAVIAEDDDNAMQESDEALPDDAEEQAIARNLAREGGRFDEG